MSEWASYIRVSTDKQDKGEQSQRSSIREYMNKKEVEDWDEYVDLNESGANDQRTEFNKLLEAVKEGKYKYVVMPEIARLARKTSKTAEFIDEAVKNDVQIHLMDDMIEKIKASDPMSQYMAKILSIMYEQEREQLVNRVKRGVKHAQSEGKWTGQPPRGFKIENGYLKVEIEEYLTVQAALESIESGESKRSVAQKTGIPRSTLTKLYNDRKHLYLETDKEAEDERIREALDNFETPKQEGEEEQGKNDGDKNE